MDYPKLRANGTFRTAVDPPKIKRSGTSLAAIRARLREELPPDDPVPIEIPAPESSGVFGIEEPTREIAIAPEPSKAKVIPLPTSLVVTESMIRGAAKLASRKSRMSKRIKEFDTQLRVYCNCVMRDRRSSGMGPVFAYVQWKLQERFIPELSRERRKRVANFNELRDIADGIVWEVESLLIAMAMRGESQSDSQTRRIRVVSAPIEGSDKEALLVVQNRGKKREPMIISLGVKRELRAVERGRELKGFISIPLHRRRKSA